MSEYIERGAVIDAITTDGFEHFSGCLSSSEATLIELLRDSVSEIPAADVVAVKHGRWEDRPTGRYLQMQSWCTACGKHSGIGGIESNRHKPYCPNCGAKMGGDSK